MNVDWMDQAACAQADPTQFCPDETAPGRPKARAFATTYCADCPVIQQCAAFADHPSRYASSIGVWGGVVRWHKGSRLHRLNLIEAVS